VSEAPFVHPLTLAFEGFYETLLERFAERVQETLPRAREPVTRLLTVEEVAGRYQTSPKAIHDKTRIGTIPHIKRVGFRRVLFDPAELEAWDRGAALEIVDSGDGSRIVRTISR
jgi:predicted DNA-binding transcriptional regulator AlpA